MSAHKKTPKSTQRAAGCELSASPVRLSATAMSCLRRSIELVERITPGNCSHHAGNIRVMLRAVLDEAERKANKNNG